MLSGAEIWMLVNIDIHLDLKIPLREDKGFRSKRASSWTLIRCEADIFQLCYIFMDVLMILFLNKPVTFAAMM